MQIKHIHESNRELATNTVDNIDHINTINIQSVHSIENPTEVCPSVFVCYTYCYSTELQIWYCTPDKLINGMEALYNKLGTELQMEREG